MISKKTKYALKALVALAEDYGRHQPLLISALAKKEKIPQKFLEVILLELKNYGMLQSKKGKGGGYSLARSPERIQLGNVMRVLEGPLAPLPCLSQTAYQKCDDCRDEETCAVRIAMKDLQEATAKILDRTNLQDMIERVKNQTSASMYFI